MKHLLIAILIASTLAALVGVAALWNLQTREPSPQDEQVLVLKNQITVENLRLQQEVAKQETAKLTAKLNKERAEQERQANIQAAPVVVKSRVTLTAFLYLLPMILTGCAAIGTPVYFIFRRTDVEITPTGIKTALPARQVQLLCEQNLAVMEKEAFARSMAYTEDVSQSRFKADADMVRALKSGHDHYAIQPSQPALPAATEKPVTTVPTFDELLRAGKFEPGKPMVFGFKEQGDPKTGTWKDAYSLGIAGESGSGKSTTIRCVVAQSFLTQAVGKAFFLDPHYPHPESLLASMGELIHAPQVRYAENRIETLDLIDEIHGHIDRRLAGQEPSEPVIIVVVDELPVLVKKFPKIADLMERIGMESRKAGVYGIFAAQSWNSDKVGGTTARDNLTALMVHTMKRKQANTLLQDNDLAKQVDKLQKGQVLFSPTQGKPEILTVPYCAIEDMPEVVRRLANGGTVTMAQETMSLPTIKHRDNVVTFPVTPRTATPPVTSCDAAKSQAKSGSDSPVEIVRNMVKSGAVKISDIADQAKIDRPYLTNILNGKRPATESVTQKLQSYLTTEQVTR